MRFQTDNDYLYVRTRTTRHPWGDPVVKQSVEIVVAHRYTFRLTFGRPM
jgi:hypothetical protein